MTDYIWFYEDGWVWLEDEELKFLNIESDIRVPVMEPNPIDPAFVGYVCSEGIVQNPRLIEGKMYNLFASPTPIFKRLR